MIRRNNKRALYESIMRDVARIVKRHLNESRGQRISQRFKNSPYSPETDILLTKKSMQK